ncbi:MAG: hypothetical protein JNJ83_04540 [Verrucomicrobiaceae bacterium]|nr:hypothetical protein [Verrucomicrobiaceae bacterium]
MRDSVFIIALLAVLHSMQQQTCAALNFDSMPIDKVREIVRLAAPGDSSFEVVEAALKSRRQEVILACNESPTVRSTLSDRVLRMEDCYLKGQLLIMDLRHGKFWDDGHSLRMNNQQSMQAEFFLPMVRQYLPETPIDYEVISSPGLRKALADTLEVAVKKKWGIIEGDSSSVGKHQGLIPTPSDKNASAIRSPAPLFIQSLPGKRPPETAPTVPTSIEEPPSSTRWSIIVVLIVAATGLLWLLLKNRK